MGELPIYLLLDLFCLAGPLAFSFDRRTCFYRHWGHLSVGIVFMWVLFLPWDIAFTDVGIWGFNPDYLVGLWFLGLPLEEWLFFISVPYACAFVYVSVGHFFPSNPLKKAAPFISLLVAAVSACLLAIFFDRAYTAVTSGLCLVAIGIVIFWLKPKYLGHFYLSYIFVAVPFLLINGVLTGLNFWQYPLLNSSPDLINDSIVWYNNNHNTGLRIFSVPADDFLYAFLMQFLVIIGFEESKKKKAAKSRPN